MCGSMVDIQCAAAEIRRGKKEDRKKPQDKNIMVCPIPYGDQLQITAEFAKTVHCGIVTQYELIMVALCNRADHYILPCDFYLLSSFFFLSSPNLSRCIMDVCHTSTHGVALVRI